MEIVFGPEEDHGASEIDQKSPDATTRVEGTPPYLVATLWTLLTCSWRQHLLYIPKLPEHNLDQEFRRRKPL